MIECSIYLNCCIFRGGCLVSCSMNTANYHQELKSILKRMDCFLSLTDLVSALPSHEVVEGVGVEQQHVIIEAKPSYIAPLVLPREQQREGVKKIPSLYQDQASRREYMEAKTALRTSMTMQELQQRCESEVLPSSLTLWHSSDSLKRMVVLVRRDLDLLFQSDLGGIPYDATDGLFALPGNHHLCYRDCMRLLVKRAPYVHKAMLEYARMACVMYGCEFRRFLAAGRPRIQKIKACVGLPLKLIQSRQARFDGGPVFVVSFGMPIIAHDFAPVVSREENTSPPFRLHVFEGCILILDGDVRACYSHGLPGVQGSFSTVYVMTIHMDCLDTTSVMDYEPLTKTVVMHTPLRGCNVITTRSAPISRIHSHISVQSDTMWRIVQEMRWRLQMAESNLIRSRCEHALNSCGDETRPSVQG